MRVYGAPLAPRRSKANDRERCLVPSGWSTTPLPRPHRVMLVGAGAPGYFAASEDEKRDVFQPRFRRMLAEWEELGARVVASFCDDVFQVGQGAQPAWAWYLIFEVDDLDVAAAMVQAVREPVEGVRLDTYVTFELRVGRPFWAREEHDAQDG